MTSQPLRAKRPASPAERPASPAFRDALFYYLYSTHFAKHDHRAPGAAAGTGAPSKYRYRCASPLPALLSVRPKVAGGSRLVLQLECSALLRQQQQLLGLRRDIAETRSASRTAASRPQALSDHRRTSSLRDNDAARRRGTCTTSPLKPRRQAQVAVPPLAGGLPGRPACWPGPRWRLCSQRRARRDVCRCAFYVDVTGAAPCPGAAAPPRPTGSSDRASDRKNSAGVFRRRWPGPAGRVGAACGPRNVGRRWARRYHDAATLRLGLCSSCAADVVFVSLKGPAAILDSDSQSP